MGAVKNPARIDRPTHWPLDFTYGLLLLVPVILLTFLKLTPTLSTPIDKLSAKAPYYKPGTYYNPYQRQHISQPLPILHRKWLPKQQSPPSEKKQVTRSFIESADRYTGCFMEGNKD